MDTVDVFEFCRNSVFGEGDWTWKTMDEIQLHLRDCMWFITMFNVIDCINVIDYINFFLQTNFGNIVTFRPLRTVLDFNVWRF